MKRLCCLALTAALAGSAGYAESLTREQIQQRLASPPADFTNLEAPGANLSGIDFAGASLFGANLKGANLSDANLARCNLNVAILRDAVLVNADLREAKLFSSVVANADLTKADLSGAQFARRIDRGDLRLFGGVDGGNVRAGDPAVTDDADIVFFHSACFGIRGNCTRFAARRQSWRGSQLELLQKLNDPLSSGCQAFVSCNFGRHRLQSARQFCRCCSILSHFIQWMHCDADAKQHATAARQGHEGLMLHAQPDVRSVSGFIESREIALRMLIQFRRAG